MPAFAPVLSAPESSGVGGVGVGVTPEVLEVDEVAVRLSMTLAVDVVVRRSVTTITPLEVEVMGPFSLVKEFAKV